MSDKYFHQITFHIFLRAQTRSYKFGLDFPPSSITELYSPIVILNALLQLTTQISCCECLS